MRESKAIYCLLFLYLSLQGTFGQGHFEDADRGVEYSSSYYNDDQQFDIRHNIPGEPEIDYPIYSVPPKTGFSCENRHDGYYADVASRCQVFRICTETDLTGEGFAFLCPNGTLFSQELFVCDWYKNVDCEASEDFYFMNENIGKIAKSKEDMIKVVREMVEYPINKVTNTLKDDTPATGSAHPPKSRVPPTDQDETSTPHNPHRTNHRTSHRAPPRTTQRPTQRTTQRPTQRTTERQIQRTRPEVIRNRESATRAQSERNYDRTTDRSSDRTSERTSDRSSGRAPDRTSGRTSSRTTDRAPDRTFDRTSDRSYDRSSDRSTERTSSRTSSRTSERTSNVRTNIDNDYDNYKTRQGSRNRENDEDNYNDYSRNNDNKKVHRSRNNDYNKNNDRDSYNEDYDNNHHHDEATSRTQNRHRDQNENEDYYENRFHTHPIRVQDQSFEQEDDEELEARRKFIPSGRVYVSSLGELSTDRDSTFDPKSSYIIGESSNEFDFKSSAKNLRKVVSQKSNRHHPNDDGKDSDHHVSMGLGSYSIPSQSKTSLKSSSHSAKKTNFAEKINDALNSLADLSFNEDEYVAHHDDNNAHEDYEIRIKPTTQPSYHNERAEDRGRLSKIAENINSALEFGDTNDFSGYDSDLEGHSSQESVTSFTISKLNDDLFGHKHFRIANELPFQYNNFRNGRQRILFPGSGFTKPGEQSFRSLQGGSRNAYLPPVRTPAPRQFSHSTNRGASVASRGFINPKSHSFQRPDHRNTLDTLIPRHNRQDDFKPRRGILIRVEDEADPEVKRLEKKEISSKYIAFNNFNQEFTKPFTKSSKHNDLSSPNKIRIKTTTTRRPSPPTTVAPFIRVVTVKSLFPNQRSTTTKIPTRSTTARITRTTTTTPRSTTRYTTPRYTTKRDTTTRYTTTPRTTPITTTVAPTTTTESLPTTTYEAPQQTETQDAGADGETTTQESVPTKSNVASDTITSNFKTKGRNIISISSNYGARRQTVKPISYSKTTPTSRPTITTRQMKLRRLPINQVATDGTTTTLPSTTQKLHGIGEKKTKKPVFGKSTKVPTSTSTNKFTRRPVLSYGNRKERVNHSKIVSRFKFGSTSSTTLTTETTPMVPTVTSTTTTHPTSTPEIPKPTTTPIPVQTSTVQIAPIYYPANTTYATPTLTTASTTQSPSTTTSEAPSGPKVNIRIAPVYYPSFSKFRIRTTTTKAPTTLFTTEEPFIPIMPNTKVAPVYYPALSIQKFHFTRTTTPVPEPYSLTPEPPTTTVRVAPVYYPTVYSFKISSVTNHTTTTTTQTPIASSSSTSTTTAAPTTAAPSTESSISIPSTSTPTTAAPTTAAETTTANTISSNQDSISNSTSASISTSMSYSTSASNSTAIIKKPRENKKNYKNPQKPTFNTVPTSIHRTNNSRAVNVQGPITELFRKTTYAPRARLPTAKKSTPYVPLPGTKVTIAKSEEGPHIIVSNVPIYTRRPEPKVVTFSFGTRATNPPKHTTSATTEKPHLSNTPSATRKPSQNSAQTPNPFLPFPTISPGRKTDTTTRYYVTLPRVPPLPQAPTVSEVSINSAKDSKKSPPHADRRVDTFGEDDEPQDSLYKGVSSYHVPLNSVGRLPFDIQRKRR